jgi:hypothetical protein
LTGLTSLAHASSLISHISLKVSKVSEFIRQ